MGFCKRWVCIGTTLLVAVVANAGQCQRTLVDQGKQIVEQKTCRNCHSIAGKGASGPGPDLNRVAERRTQNWLRRWLRDPQTIKPGTLMPTFGFTDAQIDALVAFLGSLATTARTEVTPSAPGPRRTSGSSLPLIKSWLAAMLIALTLVAAWSMFERLGSPRRGWVSRESALLIHRINGYLFALLALVISQFCVRALLRSAGEWSPRATIHITVAVIALVVMGIKIALARRYSAGLGNLLPPLGIILVIATWILVAGSAGYYFMLSAGR